MDTAGSKTSEYRLSKLMTVLNVAVAVLGAVMTALHPSTMAYAILAAAVAAMNAYISSSYSKSRSDVKAAEMYAARPLPLRD